MSDASEYKDNVVPLTARLSDRPGGGGLQPPSGGGGLEARLARVESDVSHLQRDVTEIKTDQKTVIASLARLEELSGRFDERLKNLPTKGFVVGGVILSLSLIAALIAFGDQIRTFVQP